MSSPLHLGSTRVDYANAFKGNAFVGPTYAGRSLTIDSQECMNLFPEPAQSQDSKSPIALIGTPGLLYRSIIGSGQAGGNRNMFVSAHERAFAVVGIHLYEIQSDLKSIERGTLLTDSGRVSFAEVVTASGSYIMIVDGKNGYVFDTATNVFSVITSPGYIPGTSVVSISGFFVQNTIQSSFGGSRFIFSQQYGDATNWDPLDYFTKEASPDPILSIQTINSELWLFGSKTTEVWQYTGNITQLFARITSGFINIGVSDSYAVTALQNNVFWLGSSLQGSKAVWQASGFIPQEVSTHAIEYILGTIDTSDCICYSYLQEGHFFVVFNFPLGNRTLVYDSSTGMWHERGSYNTAQGINGHHRAISVINWQDTVYVGDYSSNRLYQWDLSTYTDDGVMIVRHRTAAHQHADRKRIFFREFEIDLERGVGLLPAIGSGPSTSVTGPAAVSGQDPQAMLQWSDDGGVTWSNERWASAGPRGKRIQRIHWHRLGYSRDRVFRVFFSDPVKWVIVDARMDADVAGQ